MSRHTVKEMILSGNLYSLQSVILSQLAKSENVGRVLRVQMKKFHDQIENLYRGQSSRMFMKLIKTPLLKIWWLREVLLEAYVKRHPVMEHLEVFSKLKVRKHEISSMEVARWTADIAQERYFRPCCPGCIIF